jgi:hypothetical protein
LVAAGQKRHHFALDAIEGDIAAGTEAISFPDSQFIALAGRPMRGDAAGILTSARMIAIAVVAGGHP